MDQQYTLVQQTYTTISPTVNWSKIVNIWNLVFGLRYCTIIFVSNQNIDDLLLKFLNPSSTL